MKLILHIIEVLYSIFRKPLVYKEQLITLFTLLLTLFSLVVTAEPYLRKLAQPNESKNSTLIQEVSVVAIASVFILLGSGLTLFFEIKKINEKFAEIKTDDEGQSKKILEYISTIDAEKIDIFDQHLEERIWNKEILDKLNEKGAKIYVKNKEDLLKGNQWLAKIIDNPKHSKIEIKEWGSTALTRILNIDSLHSRFILVNYEGPDDDSFYSYKRTMEAGEPVYQNFIYSDKKHPIVEMSKDFYHIVEKIRDFSDQLNRPIGYYFVRVLPVNAHPMEQQTGEQQTGEQQTQEFSLVEVQAQGEYRIRYRGAGLSREKDTISSKWNSTVASFHESVPDSRSRLLFFTRSSHIQIYNDNIENNIENWGVIEFNNSGKNGDNKWSLGEGYFFDIKTDDIQIDKKAKIELIRIEIVETETGTRGMGTDIKLTQKQIEIFEDFFTNPSKHNNQELANLIKEVSESYL